MSGQDRSIPNPLLLTKADFLTAEDLEALARTQCGLPCTGCGEVLVTERDFAEHFVLGDARYLNLGECPDTERGRAMQQTTWANTRTIYRKDES